MDNEYGFLNRLPDNVHICREVNSGYSGPETRWLTTGEVQGAKDHCGAVMAANTRLCLGGLAGTDRSTLLHDAYAEIGDGPIIRGIQLTRRFLEAQGLYVRTYPVRRLRFIIHSLAQQQPCALLVLGPNIRAWHWILACGYVQTDNSGVFLKIADGWHNTTYYYHRGNGSRIICGAAFARLNCS